jgi:putative ATPase
VRPKNFDDVFGQNHLVGRDGTLRKLVSLNEIPSFILWGPPGTGKTTIARIVAKASGFLFVPFSAVTSGIKEVREVMAEAERARLRGGQTTIVFVDEIHRFNKAQQDAFLPYVEKGDIILIGATTENPSFEVNGALLSRMRVFVIQPISISDQISLLRRAIDEDEILKRKSLQVSDEVLEHLASRNPGDARASLNLLEAAAALSSEGIITRKVIDQAAQRVALLYDKGGEEHYNVISALHKSMRNGDADASLYWLGRMLESGDDPLYVARRLVRFASEDIGNADPQALILAMAARDAVHFIGMPEGKLALAQLVIYLAAAPKSNSVYVAYEEVEGDFRAGRVYPVPLQIRNAPTKLMKELEYGKGYEYAHDSEEKTAAMQCLPEQLKDRKYYQPVAQGFEREIEKRLSYWSQLRKKRDENR